MKEIKVANVTTENLKEIKNLEQKMGVVLVAYEKDNDKKGS